MAVVAEDGIKWRNGKTDDIDNGRSKVKVVHTHATHSYVLSMNYRTTKHIYIHKHREENEENKVLQDHRYAKKAQVVIRENQGKSKRSS